MASGMSSAFRVASTLRSVDTRSPLETPDAESVSSPNAMLASESLSDSAAPQERYQLMVREHVLEAMPGVYMVASREAVEATLKNSAVYSSEGGFLELGNVRPLIPLSVDPPRHLT